MQYEAPSYFHPQLKYFKACLRRVLEQTGIRSFPSGMQTVCTEVLADVAVIYTDEIEGRQVVLGNLT